MNSNNGSSRKELQIISHTGNPESKKAVQPFSMQVQSLLNLPVSEIFRKIFLKGSSEKNTLVQVNIQKGPLEELMGNVSKGIDKLEDDSIMTYARGLHGMFGNKVKRDRETKIKYINSVIMPLTGEENQELPRILIDEFNAVIMGFSKLINERIELTKKQKVARLK